MRKKFIFSAIVITFIGLFLYLDWSERNFSFATPVEALGNVRNPSFEVLEIIREIEGNDSTYVFFYSQMKEPNDYYVVSEFEKGKYGWQFVGMFGGGNIINANANGSLSVGGVESGEYYGLATGDVHTVKLGHLEAELIPLDKQNMKVWIFFNPTSDDMDNELKFLD